MYKRQDIIIPANSNSGETLTIRHRGLPHSRSKKRGDVVVLLKLHMPERLTKDVKKTLSSIRDHLAPEDIVERILKDSNERRRS